MKSKKNIFILTIITLLTVGAILLSTKNYLLSLNHKAANTNSNILTLHDINADIKIYGDNVKMDDDLSYTKIDKINDNTLSTDDSHGYTSIVVADLSGQCKISDDEFLLIKDLVESKGYDFMYLGTQYLTKLQSLNFTRGFNSDEMGFEYIGSDKSGQKSDITQNNKSYACHGVWSKSEQEIYKKKSNYLSQIIIAELAVNVKAAQNNQD